MYARCNSSGVFALLLPLDCQFVHANMTSSILYIYIYIYIYIYTNTHKKDDLKHNNDECKYLKNMHFNLFAQHPLSSMDKFFNFKE